MTTVQEKELEVLKEIIKVFENNELHYCAIGGTCLGAVRHKGFIPWDDDIDIVLPRREYEMFRNELYRQLPKHLQKLDCDCNESVSYDNLYMKVHDSTTSLIEKGLAHDRFTGAFVDVYPLDGRPDRLLARRIWYAKYTFLMLSNARRRAVKEKITNPRELVKDIYSKILKKVFRYNYFTDKIRIFMSRYDISQCKTAIWNGAGRKSAKLYDFDLSFSSDWFLDTISVPFEDITIQIPRRYHDYLTMQFGDYMKLPPKNEQGGCHNIIICDMETPCQYYADLVSEGKLDPVTEKEIKL